MAKGLCLPSVNELWDHCVANGIDQPFDQNNPSGIMRSVVEVDPTTGCKSHVYKHVLFSERVCSYVESQPDLLSMACEFYRGKVGMCTTMAKRMNGKYFAPTAEKLQTILVEHASQFAQHLSTSQNHQLKLTILQGVNEETQAAAARSRLNAIGELSRNRVRERVFHQNSRLF